MGGGIADNDGRYMPRWATTAAGDEGALAFLTSVAAASSSRSS